ncbi:MAG: T9SS type A sorting domain-containing protein, partial [Crenarchaeota archaeon]|nr:T9SS type A sorting domain-containing protein [Thermoproteota archaeon]
MKKLLVLLFMNAALLSAQDFYADTTEGEYPLKVKFHCEGFFGLVHIWEFGDGEKYQSDQMDCIHTYTTPGTYTVTLRVKGDDYLWDTLVKKDYIKVTTGINSIKENQRENIYLYPNPCSSILSIKTDHAFQNYSIIDIIGKEYVKDQPFQNAIDVSYLPKGVYYIILQNKKKRISGKF